MQAYLGVNLSTFKDMGMNPINECAATHQRYLTWNVSGKASIAGLVMTPAYAPNYLSQTLAVHGNKL